MDNIFNDKNLSDRCMQEIAAVQKKIRESQNMKELKIWEEELNAIEKKYNLNK